MSHKKKYPPSMNNRSTFSRHNSSTNRSKTPEVYLSVDIESDGNNPYNFSMRSIGISAFVENQDEPIDTFYRTMYPQKKADGRRFTPEKKCMDEFWAIHPDAWNEVNTDKIEPEEAIQQLIIWLCKFNEYRIIWIASPACFDWMFLKYYYEKYGEPYKNKPDIGFYCHDLSSMSLVYRKCMGIRNKNFFYRSLAGDRKVKDHHALHDSKFQGISYMNLRKLLRNASNKVKTQTQVYYQ